MKQETGLVRWVTWGIPATLIVCAVFIPWLWVFVGLVLGIVAVGQGHLMLQRARKEQLALPNPIKDMVEFKRRRRREELREWEQEFEALDPAPGYMGPVANPADTFGGFASAYSKVFGHKTVHATTPPCLAVVVYDRTGLDHIMPMPPANPIYPRIDAVIVTDKGLAIMPGIPAPKPLPPSGNLQCLAIVLVKPNTTCIVEENILNV
jgi:hypothetical protein